MEKTEILAAREYIQEHHPGFPVPDKSFLILMSPRSGSTMLTTHLQQIGYGNPIEGFHFNRGKMRRYYDWVIDFNDPYAYMRKAIEYEMVNGVFGVKFSWPQFQIFLRAARQITNPHNESLTDIDLIHIFFPNPSFVLLKRLNKIKQAVSYSKGKQTGIWAVKAGQQDKRLDYVVPPVYNRAHIEGCLEELLAFDVAWENFLSKYQINFLEIWYEDLAKNFGGEISRIYSYFGIENQEIPEPVLARQANVKSQEWISKFKAETPWLENSNFAESLAAGDFKTAYIHRSMKLITDKEERSWYAVNRFKSVRQLIFRVRRKATQLLKLNK